MLFCAFVDFELFNTFDAFFATRLLVAISCVSYCLYARGAPEQANKVAGWTRVGVGRACLATRAIAKNRKDEASEPCDSRASERVAPSPPVVVQPATTPHDAAAGASPRPSNHSS